MEANLLLPSENETAAIALKPKTAALCYDRVWGTSDDIVPQPIRCWGRTKSELSGQGLAADYNIKTNRAPIVAMIGPEEKQLEMIRAGTDYGLAATFRDIAKSFSKEHNIRMVPIFDFIKQRDTMYRSGDREVIVTALSNLQIVDEDQLTWELVIDFRKDKENQRKYKRLLHWFDNDMVGKSQSFIEDDISLKLEDYEMALKKHGIRALIGTISETLDGKYLLGSSLMALLAGEPYLAVGLIIGKIGLQLVQKKLDFEDVERGPNSEISWVYEVKKLSGENKCF